MKPRRENILTLLFLISILVLAITIVKIPQFIATQARESLRPSLIKSSFFHDDPVAFSILSGKPYTLSDSRYLVGGTIDTLSFEFKIIQALRQLGYARLTFIDNDNPSASTVALHKFQKLNRFNVSDQLNKKVFSAIDTELAQREKLDSQVALSYDPLSKFIESPINEPPKTHLASMYADFFRAMPTHFLFPLITVDELRQTLVTGLGGNIGRMLDPTGSRILSLEEAVTVMNERGDFRFCPQEYYRKFNPADKGNCISLPTTINPSSYEDITYMTLIAHEYGHIQSKLRVENTEADFIFGKISFDMSGLQNDYDPSSIILRPANTNNEFISVYAQTNNKEDFAESFSAYIHEGNIFRLRASQDPHLKQKYKFIKQNIFIGKEFDTGDVNSYRIWISQSKSLPFHPEDYQIEKYSWRWNYKYPVCPSRGCIQQLKD